MAAQGGTLRAADPLRAPTGIWRPHAPCAVRDGMVLASLTHIDHTPMTNTSIYHLKLDKYRGALHLAERILLQSPHFHARAKKGLSIRAISYLTENLLFCPLHGNQEGGAGV